MQKIGILTASFFMLTAVALGAFGAHGLKNLISVESIAVFKTGVFYQFIHAMGIFVVVFIAKLYDIPKLKRSVWFFVIGILLFSGSLYLLSTRTYTGIEWRFLGPLTPIGGLFFMIAWLNLMLEIWRNKNL